MDKSDFMGYCNQVLKHGDRLRIGRTRKNLVFPLETAFLFFLCALRIEHFDGNFPVYSIVNSYTDTIYI
jgi:hypothetical protein